MPELLQCHGVGSAKASVIKAIQELSLRDVEHELAHADQFADSVSVSRFLRRRMGHEPRETFACLFLNARNQLISFEVLFRGSVDRAHVHAREVLRGVLKLMLSLWCWPIIIPRAPLNPVRRTSSSLGALRNFYSR